MRLAERIWYDPGPAATLVRAALTPFAWAYATAMRGRNALYDTGLLRRRRTAIPVLSVGNLTVGGTGKTPLAAHLALQLRERGARPALVMRGVGDDETRAYEFLAPDIPVIVDADRVRGVASAVAQGATVAVLDDAFQHRRIRRQADVVVISAERPGRAVLPAGPLREPSSGLSRADVAVISRKAAGVEEARALMRRLAAAFPAVGFARIALLPDDLVAWRTGSRCPLAGMSGQRALVVAAVGDPTSLLRQLQGFFAAVEPVLYRDHYSFGAGEAARLAVRAERADMVLCTLKDAVKLGPHWPRQAPELWYVSQRLEIEEGADVIERMLARLLDLRDHN